MIVPAFQRPASLHRCLLALAGQELDRRLFEVVVCDDGSEPPIEASLEAVRDRLPTDLALAVVRQENAGPAAARNRAAAEARGLFLAFTDDDCEPAPAWLSRLLVRLESRPGTMVGGGIRNGLDGEPFACATQAIMDFAYAERERDDAVRLFCTSNLSVPSGPVRELGGFSESFPFAAGEDYDFCWRWHEAGHPAVYASEAVVVHRHGGTWSSYLRQHFGYGRGLQQVRRRRRARLGSIRDPRYGFVARMILHPLASPPRNLRTSALIGLSQLATAAGAVTEALRPASLRAPVHASGGR